MKHRPFSFNRPALCVPMFAFVLAACGGGGGDAGSPAAADPASSSSGSSSAGGGQAAGTATTGSQSAAASGGQAGDTSPGVSTASARSAAECLDVASYQAGYVQTTRHRVSDGSEQLYRASTVGPVTYSGVAATEFRLEDLLAGGAAPARVIRRLSGGEVYDVAVVAVQRSGGIDYTVEMTLSPFPLEGFSLKVGESRATGTVTTQLAASAPGQPSQSMTLTSVSTLRFAGFETVTVPAGTFTDTCRIDSATTMSGTTTRTSTWYANRHGFIVKAVDADGVSRELVGAQVGSQLIAGTVQRPTTPATTPATTPTTPILPAGGLKR